MIKITKMLGGCHPMSLKVTHLSNSRIVVSLPMYLYLQACRDSRPTLGCRSRCILDKLLLLKLQWACPPCLVGQVCISVLDPYLCICNLYLYFLGMSPMSAMSAAGLAATSAATNSYPVLFVYFCFNAFVFFMCIFCIWVFLVFEILFQVSSSPLASVMHNSAIGAMT